MLMSAILLTRGPVSTCGAVHRYGPVSVRRLKTPHFIEAARELEAANLGKLVSITSSNGRSMFVFIKKHPDEMHEPLIGNEDLCGHLTYEQNFNMEVPASCVTPNVFQRLVEMGYIMPC